MNITVSRLRACLLVLAVLVAACNPRADRAPPVALPQSPSATAPTPLPPAAADEPAPPPPGTGQGAPPPQPATGDAGAPGRSGAPGGSGATGATGAPAAGLPDFAWPPPKASASATVPFRATLDLWRKQHRFPPRPANSPVYLNPDLLDAFYRADPLLTHADHALRYILSGAGYLEVRYYAVPGGFALVTRIEQIEADGKPKEPGRWDAAASFTGPFSIGGYLRSLFKAPRGRYRILVFVLTPVPFSQSSREVSREDAEAWLDIGANALPREVAMRPFTWDYGCTVLIYEFEKTGAEQAASLLHPGLPVAVHLAGARLEGLMP
jgi:hypothetical protein